MHLLIRELKDSWRRLRHQPSFSFLTMLTLALGLGATLALSSVVISVLLKPLDLPQPERLASLWHAAPGLEMPKFEQSHATYLLYREHAKSLESMALYTDRSQNLTGEGPPERVEGAVATPSLFQVLKTAPAAGRLLIEADGKPGAPPVVVVSADLAERRFGSLAAAVGRRVELDEVAREIVGVAPAGFSFPKATTELWLPLEIDEAKPEVGNFNYGGVARLKPGRVAADLSAELTAALNILPDAYPGDISRPMMEQAQMRAFAVPLLEDMVGETARLLWTLLAAVVVVLLVAAANVANLLLVRAEGRGREMAIKGALGAGGRHQLLGWMVESLLLCLAGTAFGLLLARWGVAALVAYGPEDLPRRHEIAVGPEAVALAFALACLMSLGFSLLSFFRSRRRHTYAALTGGLRGATAGRERLKAQNLLVASQVALALVLLAASGLLAQSFFRLKAVEPGFDSAGVLTARVALPRAKYADLNSVQGLYEQIRNELAAIPGVSAVGGVSGLPLTSQRSQSGIALEDFPRQADELPPIMPNVHVLPGYFETLEIPLLEGRTLTAADNSDASGACVVSQSFARHFWPQGSALGRRLQMGIGEEGAWLTIVGVVADVRHDGFEKPAPEMLYLPVVGKSGPAGWIPYGMSFVLKTEGSPERLGPDLRRVLAGIDPDLPLAEMRTLETVRRQATASPAFAMSLLLVSALAAVALGAVGLYGVISYLVARRRREIGVRLALGAERGEVARMVVRQGLVTSLFGLVVGLIATLAGGGLIRELLYETSPSDPTTLAAVAALLVVICALASWFPARRAAAVAPVEALVGE